ncbi:MAG: DoxX family protein [Rhodospirillales bacterium]|nr:DoxX family protein [Rhodospirillales bacterium]
MSTIGTDAIRPLVPPLARITETLSPYAEPLVRITTGLLLVPHGSQKLFGWFGGAGIAGTEQFFASKLGLPPWIAVLAGLVEFGGGLLLALGLVTRVAAALVAGLMTVAVIQVHVPNGFFWTEGGYEYPLLWGILALSFVIRGGGRFSLDAVVGREI